MATDEERKATPHVAHEFPEEEDHPDISLGVAPVGRATRAAIDAEIAQSLFEAPPRPKRAAMDDGPVIEVGEASVGRETMAAIEAQDSGFQQRRTDPSQVPGIVRRNSPVFADREPPSSGARGRMRTMGFSEPPPEPDRGQRVGRNTFDAIERELETWARRSDRPSVPDPDTSTALGDSIFEMVTFVVKGDPATLASEEARRRFVARRLKHRLPIRSLEEVHRIDVTPWTVRGTLVVRVWCVVDEPADG